VTVDVRPVNDDPAAKIDRYMLEENNILGAGSPGVLGNDSDIDGDSLTASLVAGPTHGSLILNSDGSFTYTPNEDFTGLDTFSYLASDNLGGSATAMVFINVSPSTIPPADTNTEPEDPDPVDTVMDDPGMIMESSETPGILLTQYDTGRDPSATDRQGIPTDGSASNGSHAWHDHTNDDAYANESSTRSSLLSALESFSVSGSELLQMIDEMKSQMDSRFEGSQGLLNLLAKSATGMTLTFSAGIVTWALRGGSVLASMLSSMPLWKGFDPLPIITGSRKHETEDDHEHGGADTALDQTENKAEHLLDSLKSGENEQRTGK
jgi:hypothetical protein